MASDGRLVAGRYFLESVIGTGGMGVVWRAYDLRLARWVAVKEIRFDQYVTPQERDEIKQRAMGEALLAGRLFHPNIVAVYDAVEDADKPWVVMRLVEGRSLRQLVKEDGPLEPMAAVRLGLGLLDALDAAHAAGVIHRDVKPSNVLVQSDGRPLLSDFSIATVSDAQAAIRTVAVMGSPGYVAPERLHGAPGGAPADLFGLGATLFYAVEGVGPFTRGDTMACLVATVCEPHPRPRRAGPLTPVIDALLAKDVADRLDAAGARAALLRAGRPRRRRRATTPHPPPASRHAYLPPWRTAAPALPDTATGATPLRDTASLDPAALARRRIGRRGRVALVTAAAALLLPMAAALASLTATPDGTSGGRIAEARPVPPGAPASNPPRRGVTLAMPDMASPTGAPEAEALPGAVLTTDPVARPNSPTPEPSGNGGAAPVSPRPRPPARVTGLAVTVSVAADCTYSVSAAATVSRGTTVTYQVTGPDGATSTHTATAASAGTVALPVPGGGPLTAGPVRVQVAVLQPSRTTATGSADLPPQCTATPTPSPTTSISPATTGSDPAPTAA